MNASRKTAPSEEGRVLLETLKRAVSQTLDRKKRLGHYAVIWANGKAVAVGEDAPKEPGVQRQDHSSGL
jgi:hypothetical protein